MLQHHDPSRRLALLLVFASLCMAGLIAIVAFFCIQYGFSLQHSGMDNAAQKGQN